jgi:glycosyltransferase involved in cell wall biosynthesis
MRGMTNNLGLPTSGEPLMKLVVQIPCLNEAHSLGDVIESIPKKIAGCSSIEIVVVDDGSTDGTAAVAASLGVKTIIRHHGTRGLAEAFRSGLDYALSKQADIIVNTDGDNQYPQEKIAELVAPILEGRADIVIGDRRTHRISHFSVPKKILQHLGSKVVSVAAGVRVPDAGSGFRAYSRTAALKLNLVTKYSYTMETIIQAGYKRLSIVSIPIRTNPKTRESRLFKSTPEHVTKSAAAIIRSLLMYRPYAFFGSLGVVLGGLGLIPYVRFLVHTLTGTAGEYLQSLIFGASLITAALLSLALGVLADLIRINRQLIEDGLALQKAHQDELSLSDLVRLK